MVGRRLAAIIQMIQDAMVMIMRRQMELDCLDLFFMPRDCIEIMMMKKTKKKM
jgi:hypothetical protein